MSVNDVLLVMFTVIETPSFARLWPDYWTQEELDEFIVWIAGNAEYGDVIPGAGGCRKVRWSRAGMGSEVVCASSTTIG